MSRNKDIKVWEMFTDLDDKKQGLAVYLTLTRRVQEAVMDIPAAELGENDELGKIIQKLDSIFLKQEKTQA